MSALVGTGVFKNGALYGNNMQGDLVSGHKVGEGQWSLTNQNNGAQFDAKKGEENVWNVTRTDPESGEQTSGDFSVFTAGNRVSVYDFDRDGFKPQA